MTDKKLALLGIAAVILAGAAILQSRLMQRAGSNTIFQSSPLIQGLALDAIAGVTITSEKGAAVLTLKKAGDKFVVADKDGYPADVSKINTLLNNCLDIRTTEKTTSDPANHADLGVTDATARYGVRFLNADGKEITGVLISENQSDRQEGAYARLTTSDETYFIQSSPWLSTKAMEFINSTLITADRAKMRKVTVKGPNEEYQLTVSEAGGAVTLEKMPAEKQFKETTYQSVFGAVSSLQFDDVRAAENTPEGLVFDRSFICQMEDTTVYEIALAQKGDKTYMKVSADFLDKAPVEKERRVESADELKVKESKLLASDAVKAFNAQHKGWVYEIASSKAKNLTTPLEELLEDKPAPVAEAKAEPTAPVTADPNTL